MLIIEQNNTFEMANVAKTDTNLPYNIWIDSVGKDRNIPHNIPRIKINVDGDMIPVSIDTNPKILINKNINNFSEIKNWIIKYYDILMQHWNKELTDKETLNLLGK